MAEAPSDTVNVLHVLREGAAEGYALLSKTGLDRNALARVLRELLAKDIIFVRGELEPERVGDAYVSVRPSARGQVEQMFYRQAL